MRIKTFQLITLVSSVYCTAPVWGMDEEAKNDATISSPVKTKPQDANKNDTPPEGSKQSPPNASLKNPRQYDGVFKLLDVGQSFSALGSFGCTLYECTEGVQNAETINFITKVCSSLGRMGLGALNMYETGDTQHASSILRGAADLLSLFTDKKVSEYTAILKENKKDEKRKKQKLDFTVNANIKNKNKLVIQQQSIDKKVERANRLLKSKEEDTVKEATEMLVEASGEKAAVEKELAFLDEDEKRLRSELTETRERLVLAKQKRDNHDKGSLFIRAAGLLSEELMQNKDQPSIGDYAQNVATVMIKLAKVEPVRTAKYGAEIATHLRSFVPTPIGGQGTKDSEKKEVKEEKK